MTRPHPLVGHHPGHALHLGDRGPVCDLARRIFASLSGAHDEGSSRTGGPRPQVHGVALARMMSNEPLVGTTLQPERAQRLDDRGDPLPW